jgi:YD repeat-containing protein
MASKVDSSLKQLIYKNGMDMKKKPVFLAVMSAIAWGTAARADYVPKQYIYSTAIKSAGVIYSSPTAFCDAAIKAAEAAFPYNKYTLVQTDVQGVGVGTSIERKNEGSIECYASWVVKSPFVGGGGYGSVGRASIESYCQNESSSHIPDSVIANKEYEAWGNNYAIGINIVYNSAGNKLKSCQCQGPQTGFPDFVLKQVGNKCVPDAEAATYKVEEKNTASNSGVCGVGNPINPATGAKYLAEVDYNGQAGEVPLRFERQYNSQIDGVSPSMGLGWGWRHTYSRALVFDTADVLPRVRVSRPDGGAVVFQQQADGSFTQDADVNDRLVSIKDGAGVVTGYKFTVAEGPEGLGVVEMYDAAGHIQSLKTLGGWMQNFAWSTDATPADIAPSAGYLISVTDSSGRQLQFKYNSGGQLHQVVDPAARIYEYAYDDNDNLVSVTNPRLEVRTYHYNEADHIQQEDGTYGTVGEQAHLFHALTGITDEATIRYADYFFQFDGKGVVTTHALGAEKHILTYGADGSTTVTDPLGQARVYKFEVSQGVAQPQDQDQPCSTGSPYKSVKSDANGNPQYQIDFNGNRTNYVYDTVRNLETSRQEGLNADGSVTTKTMPDGSKQMLSRTTTTEWHLTLRQPAKVAQPLKLTSYEYYPNGLLKTRTEQATTDTDGSKGLSATLVDIAVLAPRVWSYTYNTEGQVLTIDGPRKDVLDVTTMTYFPSTDSATPPKWHKGDVQTVKNSVGHITTFNEYDEHGNVLKITDANGLQTQFWYDELGRINSQTVGALTASYTYDKRGMIETVALPSGENLTYSYDDAHRLKTITDRDGNRTEYAELDAMGNRKDERVYGADNLLVRKHSRNYNLLNRLEQDIGATSPSTQITKYEYFLGGQLKKVTDALSHVTELTYDPLNRLQDTTLPVPELNVPRPVVSYGYDGQNHLINVTDPRQIQTSYTVDGLGNRTAVNSADAGAQSFTPDEAGNIKAVKDAKLQNSTYSYDELNRVKGTTFHDGSKLVYQYDTGSNAKGRLNQIQEIDALGGLVTQLDIVYDGLGRVHTQTRLLAGKSVVTQYDYDNSGRLETLIYPSGRKVTYSYDTSGRISGISTTPSGGTAVAVLSSVKYHPFGGVKQYTYGNGQVQTLAQDLDGRSTGYFLGAATYAVDYDDANRIKTIRHTTDLAQTMSYAWDGLSRLSSANLPATSYGYKYDGVGNRTKFTSGASSTTYGYDANRNWLKTIGATSLGFDANGSLQTGAAGSFTHDVRGRLSKLVGAGGTTTYGVDAWGLRIRKTNGQGDVLYTYDADGNLLDERTPTGVVIKEYIYLGSRPVAVVAQ